MRLYWEVGKRAFQRQLAYRSANVNGLITTVCFGYLRSSVLLDDSERRGREYLHQWWCPPDQLPDRELPRLAAADQPRAGRYHSPDDARRGRRQALCSRLLIIDHGKLLYDDSLEQSRDRFGAERTLVVELADGDGEGAEPLSVAHAQEVRTDGPRRWLRFSRAETTAADLIASVASRYRIRDSSIEEPEIEAIIRRIYEDGIS